MHPHFTDFVALPGESDPLNRARKKYTEELWMLRGLPPKTSRTEVGRISKAILALAELPGEILQYDDAYLEEGLVARRWTHGLALLEVLRQRGRLKPEEILPLLAAAAPLLTLLHDQNIPIPVPLLSKIYVEPACTREESPTEIDLNEPWVLRLDPLRFSVLLPVALGQTLPRGPSLPGALSSPTCALVDLAIELFNGRISANRQLHPIAGAGEKTNEFLRASIEQGCTGSAADFVAKLETACREDGHPLAVRPMPPRAVEVARPEPVIPKKAANAPGGLSTKPAPRPLLHSRPQTGDTLRLDSREGRSVRVTSGSCYRIGRAASTVDFLATHAADTPALQELNREISRVHVIAKAAPDRISFRDGDGIAASLNGSALDKERLSSDHALILRGPGVLSLASQFRIEVRPLRAGAFAERARLVKSLQLQESGEEEPLSEAPGGVFFTALDHPVLHDGLWLLNSVGLAISDDGGILWKDDGPQAAPASLWRLGGGFLLLNRTIAAEKLLVDGIPQPVGSMIGLQTGQRLLIGSTTFRASVIVV